MTETVRGDHARYMDGVARMIRAAGKRAADSDPEDLAELLRLQDELSKALDLAVASQSERYSWSQIAKGLGVTRQAAFKRFGRVSA